MKNSRYFIFLVILVMTFMLAACGGGEAEATEQAPLATEASEEPTATTEPTATPEPTATSEPTATPEPTATADPASAFELFEDIENGVSMRYPGEWFTEGSFGFNVFASSEELLDLPEPGDEGGVALLVAGSAADLGSTEPVDALERTSEEFGLGDDTEFVDGPTAVTINGQSAAVGTIHTTSDSGTPLSARLALVLNGDWVAVFIGVTPRESDAEYLPIFDAMLNTIIVTQPTVATGPDLPPSQGFLLYGDTVNGTIAASETVVWDFIGFEGETFDLTVEPSESLDVIVDVLDESGSSILSSGEVDDSFGTETVSAVAIPSTGTFYITLRGFGSSSGDYALTLAEGGASTTGDFNTAGSLVYGGRVQSSVTASSPAKWSFTAAAGDVVSIVVTPLDGTLDAVVDVLDAAGNSVLPAEVDNSFGEEVIDSLQLTAAGNYIISVRGFGTTTGNFELRLNSSSASGGGDLAYGDTAEGTIAGSETVTFTFFGEKNDLIDVTVLPLTTDFDVTLDVLDSNGRSILEDGELDESYDIERIRVQHIPENGLYTIAVRSFDGSSGDFEVIVGLTNNGYAATVLFAAYGINESDETHAFPFYALAGDEVTALVYPIANDENVALDVVLELYNDDTDELLFTIDDFFLMEELSFTAPTEGNYYFLVSSYEESIGDYDVILVGPATTQFVLAAGDFIDGHFGDDGSLIEYWYDGLAGETITLFLEGDSELDVVIRILDENGNVLAEVDQTLYGEAEELTYTFTSDLAVIIEVSDFFGNQGFFNFEVDSDI